MIQSPWPDILVYDTGCLSAVLESPDPSIFHDTYSRPIRLASLPFQRWTQFPVCRR